MYLILPKPLGMSTGKAAAQAAHAAVEAYLLSPDDNLKRVWRRGGHYKKVVLEAADLLVAERYIRDRGFLTALVIDEGLTEVSPLTPTAIGVQIVDKHDAHVAATFSVFKLYADAPKWVLRPPESLDPWANEPRLPTPIVGPKPSRRQRRQNRKKTAIVANNSAPLGESRSLLFSAANICTPASAPKVGGLHPQH